MTFRNRSKNGGDGGTGVYMWEGTTSGVTVADRPYGEFYDFYSFSPENFGYHLIVCRSIVPSVICSVCICDYIKSTSNHYLV